MNSSTVTLLVVPFTVGGIQLHIFRKITCRRILSLVVGEVFRYIPVYESNLFVIFYQTNNATFHLIFFLISGHLGCPWAPRSAPEKEVPAPVIWNKGPSFRTWPQTLNHLAQFLGSDSQFQNLAPNIESYDAIFWVRSPVSGQSSQYCVWWSDPILEAWILLYVTQTPFSIKQQGSVKKIPRSILVTTIVPFNLQLKLQSEWQPKLYFLVFI